MLFQETLMAGRSSPPQPPSLAYGQPPALITHAPHSAKVTSNLPTANGRAMVTLRCGPSASDRPGSLAGDPIMKLPAGTTTISGQTSHSRKVSPGLSARSRSGVSGVGGVGTLTAGSSGAGEAAGGGSLGGGVAAATFFASSMRFNSSIRSA